MTRMTRVSHLEIKRSINAVTENQPCLLRTSNLVFGCSAQFKFTNTTVD